MKEVYWSIINKDNITIERHKLILNGSKIVERSYILLETNEYIKI